MNYRDLRPFTVKPFPWKTLLATTAGVIGIVVFFSDRAYLTGTAVTGNHHLEEALKVLREDVKQDFQRVESAVAMQGEQLYSVQQQLLSVQHGIDRLLDDEKQTKAIYTQ